MKSYDDMYFVALLFSYGAELNQVKSCQNKKEFHFLDDPLKEIFVMESGFPTTSQTVNIDDAYLHYQRRKLLYPPNFPDGRRRFLELLHAKE